jgi:hypothetical protein
MLTIDCTFDEEFGPDGIDPLGKLRISDENCEIAIDITYLDSWLASLIDALHLLKTAKCAKFETEEPKPIEIELAADGHLTIAYRETKVVAGSLREFELALKAAVSRFLDSLKDLPSASQNRTLDPIRRFWVTTAN